MSCCPRGDAFGCIGPVVGFVGGLAGIFCLWQPLLSLPLRCAGVGFLVVEGVGQVICPCLGLWHIHCLLPPGHRLRGMVCPDFLDLLGIL